MEGHEAHAALWEEHNGLVKTNLLTHEEQACHSLGFKPGAKIVTSLGRKARVLGVKQTRFDGAASGLRLWAEYEDQGIGRKDPLPPRKGGTRPPSFRCQSPYQSITYHSQGSPPPDRSQKQHFKPHTPTAPAHHPTAGGLSARQLYHPYSPSTSPPQQRATKPSPPSGKKGQGRRGEGAGGAALGGWKEGPREARVRAGAEEAAASARAPQPPARAARSHSGRSAHSAADSDASSAVPDHRSTASAMEWEASVDGKSDVFFDSLPPPGTARTVADSEPSKYGFLIPARAVRTVGPHAEMSSTMYVESVKPVDISIKRQKTTIECKSLHGYDPGDVLRTPLGTRGHVIGVAQQVSGGGDEMVWLEFNGQNELPPINMGRPQQRALHFKPYPAIVTCPLHAELAAEYGDEFEYEKEAGSQLLKTHMVVVDRLQDKGPPLQWRHKWVPAHTRNTCGGLCAPSRYDGPPEPRTTLSSSQAQLRGVDADLDPHPPPVRNFTYRDHENQLDRHSLYKTLRRLFAASKDTNHTTSHHRSFAKLRDTSMEAAERGTGLAFKDPTGPLPMPAPSVRTPMTDAYISSDAALDDLMLPDDGRTGPGSTRRYLQSADKIALGKSMPQFPVQGFDLRLGD